METFKNDPQYMHIALGWVPHVESCQTPSYNPAIANGRTQDASTGAMIEIRQCKYRTNPKVSASTGETPLCKQKPVQVQDKPKSQCKYRRNPAMQAKASATTGHQKLQTDCNIDWTWNTGK